MIYDTNHYSNEVKRMKTDRKWKILLIHHTHTDIGYTERQEKIMEYHRGFLCQAINILNDIHAGRRKNAEGFIWQCENYWQVENFYEGASPEYRADFEKYVKAGEIGLSGTYLNMNELIDETTLREGLEKAQKYGVGIGRPITSSMTADINGFAWGYADALADSGIESLFTCIHTHHGMFPLYKKQMPFYWEAPSGKRVLVWNGDHYHLGNELGFVPFASTSYLVKDEYAVQMKNHLIYNKNESKTEDEELEVLDARLERYLNRLSSEQYEYSFVPLMVSGATTDNAPPSALIAERVHLLNERYYGQVEVQMVTLEDFFKTVLSECGEIPVYRGDWNDWWADGAGSTPAVLKTYRNAQRKLSICDKMDEDKSLGEEWLRRDAVKNMLLYAEHTWGYSSSVSEPWNSMVTDLEIRKDTYAAEADILISRNLDQILKKKGETAIRAQRKQRFKVINPHKLDLCLSAKLYVEFWEYIEGVPFYEATDFEVVEEETGKVLKSQIKRIARAFEIEVLLDMKAGEEKVLSIRRGYGGKQNTVGTMIEAGAEGVADVVAEQKPREDCSCIETDYFRILFNHNSGVESIIDKRDAKELIRKDMVAPPFSGVYECSREITDVCRDRTMMGRRRKSYASVRSLSNLKNIGVVDNGPVYITVRLDYSLEGTELYHVFLKIYKNAPLMEAVVRIHKKSVWKAENLYLSLPFTVGGEFETYIDKTGCVMRPGIDQLPGTNQDFYLVQNGAVLHGEEKDVVIGMKDTPLMVLGELEAGPVVLCDGKNREKNQGLLYSWPMNNFWETNFKADLGGFYEFTYTMLIEHRSDISHAFLSCEAINQGLISFYI